MLFWTNSVGNALQNSTYTATCLLFHKTHKLNKNTAGKEGMNLSMRFSFGLLYIDMPVLGKQLRYIYMYIYREREIHEPRVTDTTI